MKSTREDNHTFLYAILNPRPNVLFTASFLTKIRAKTSIMAVGTGGGGAGFQYFAKQKMRVYK